MSASARERRFRALLIGVDHYSDAAFPSMSFITAELRGLADALKASGYDEAEVVDADERNGTALKQEVAGFLARAVPGDHLLLVLSGHGFHQDGLDYLITGPALWDSLDFKEMCLPIEFGKYLVHRCEADQLVVAVDACRVELDAYSKAATDRLAWGKGAMGYRESDVLDSPRYAHVYACNRYGKAQFGPAADTSPGDEAKKFSYFTRALTEIAQDTTAPGFLDAVEPLLDERVRAIARENRVPSEQCVQVNYATGREDLLLFPDRGTEANLQAPEHLWQEQAVKHEAWRRVVCEQLDETQRAHAIAQVRDAVARLVGLWGRESAPADAWLAGQGDIWRPAGSEHRMSRGIEKMLRDSGPVPGPGTGDRTAPGVGLSLTEAALLVAGPFLYAAFGTRYAWLARDLRPWTLEEGTPATAIPGFADRVAFDRYCEGHLSLRDRERRARERGRDDEARAVAWWLARQWLLRLPATRKAVRHSGLAGLEVLPDGPEFEPSLVREVLAPARLRRLVKLIGLDLEQPGTPEPETVAALDAAEHVVDWQKTGTLLTVAHHMAVDPVLLSSLVAEHLGISEPVDGQAFRAALDRLTWLSEAPRRRVLSVECPHEAVELALGEHIDVLDRTLRTLLHGPVGERALTWGVPAVLGASKVRAAPGEDGKPLYDAADVRFRLDGDRVRDLLMGEQLYQDRTLALRELYQNALDACRYRQARTALWNLEHPDDQEDDWKGEIVFVQGEEGGRRFIECRDNGIGMGRHELRHLFAFAGSRFVEEREYLDERAEWDAADIPFHPNSRFGIGVLSYFMLADEIKVTTTRLGKNLLPGEGLEVTIDGPGALFRIRPKVRRQAGTTVRLYLRNPDDDVSCGEVMRRHLWVSDFDVRVKEGEREPLVWRRGVLSEYVRPTQTVEWREQDAGDGVWWCHGRGAVLADGLWAGEHRFGCVVNLTGKHAPRLRLDRGAMLDDHEKYVADLLVEKIPVLFEADGEVLCLEWLHGLVVGEWPERGSRLGFPGDRRDAGQGRLADLIAAQAVARSHHFSFPTLDGTVISDAGAVGCCPGDQFVLSHTRMIGGALIIEAEDTGPFGEWRARVWAAASPASGVLPRLPLPIARPTDEPLLNEIEGVDSIPLPPGAVLSAAWSAGVAVRYAADRLREFGLELPDDAVLQRLEDIEDLRILSRDGGGGLDWLPMGARLSAAMLVEKYGSGDAVHATARTLAGLGFELPDHGELAALLARDLQDLANRVFRRELSPTGRELPRDRPVTVSHLIVAQRIFPGQEARIAEVLTDAGYELPSTVPSKVDDLQLALISRDGDGQAPWNSEDENVPLHHVLRIARARRMDAESVVQRLAAMGITPPELPDAETSRVYERLVDDVLSFYRKGEYSIVVLPAVLHPAAVLALAWDHDLPDTEIARRLTALGYEVPGLGHPREARDYADLVLMSRGQDGLEPWLDTDHQVPRHHVVRAAHTHRLTHEDVVERLTRCGYDVAPPPPAGEWTPGDDVALLRRRFQDSDWLHPTNPVPLTHILRSAHRLNRTPTEIARRLKQLGHTLPPDIEFTDPEHTERP
ncbi:wHTH domain-containing protein [Streptomyces sp. NPDC054940]